MNWYKIASTEYFFHGTHSSNLNSILENGLMVGEKATSKHNGIYLTKSIDYALAYSDSPRPRGENYNNPYITDDDSSTLIITKLNLTNNKNFYLDEDFLSLGDDLKIPDFLNSIFPQYEHIFDDSIIAAVDFFYGEFQKDLPLYAKKYFLQMFDFQNKKSISGIEENQFMINFQKYLYYEVLYQINWSIEALTNEKELEILYKKYPEINNIEIYLNKSQTYSLARKYGYIVLKSIHEIIQNLKKAKWFNIAYLNNIGFSGENKIVLITKTDFNKTNFNNDDNNIIFDIIYMSEKRALNYLVKNLQNWIKFTVLYKGSVIKN